MRRKRNRARSCCAYAEKRGVSPVAIHNAIQRREVFPNDDGSVDVEISDAVWGRRHELSLAVWVPGTAGAIQIRID